LDRKLLNTFYAGFPFILLHVNGEWHHMMDWGHMWDGWHMTGWWGIPFMGFWWIVIWILQFIIAFVVYKDAKERNMEGLVWFILVILPWIGLLFLIGYLVIRGEESDVKESLDDALKILDDRYAKGEITRKEYLEIKKDIEKKRDKY
jgi:putative membrane protein